MYNNKGSRLRGNYFFTFNARVEHNITTQETIKVLLTISELLT